MKTANTKPMHPSFSRMICEAIESLDAAGDTQHGHSLHSLKAYVQSNYKMANGWEKRLNNTVKLLLQKKQLVHAPGHMGSFKLSKSMQVKEEKRLARKMKAEQAPKKKKAAAAPTKKVKAAPKRKAAKMEGPAKRAKKAAPKKAANKKA